MSDFKDMLKYLRKREGLSQAELARKLGLGPSTISMYEVGERQPNFEVEEKIADFFNVDLNTLRGMDSERPRIPQLPSSSGSVRIPVYSYVSAGAGCFADGNIECYVDIPEEMARHGEFFGLRVRGDSMEPEIKDQDIIIVKRQDTADDDKTVVAIVNGDEGFCKRLALYAEGLGLVSNNPAYKPLYFTKGEVINLPVKILGVVSRLIREY